MRYLTLGLLFALSLSFVLPVAAGRRQPEPVGTASAEFPATRFWPELKPNRIAESSAKMGPELEPGGIVSSLFEIPDSSPRMGPVLEPNG